MRFRRFPSDCPSPADVDVDAAAVVVEDPCMLSLPPEEERWATSVALNTEAGVGSCVATAWRLTLFPVKEKLTEPDSDAAISVPCLVFTGGGGGARGAGGAGGAGGEVSCVGETVTDSFNDLEASEVSSLLDGLLFLLVVMAVADFEACTVDGGGGGGGANGGGGGGPLEGGKGGGGSADTGTGGTGACGGGGK